MADRAYSTSGYRRMKRLLAENEIMCHWCHVNRATTPDHMVPVVLGGTDNDLVPSCAPCNLKRGGRLGVRLRTIRRRNRRSLLEPWP